MGSGVLGPLGGGAGAVAGFWGRGGGGVVGIGGRVSFGIIGYAKLLRVSEGISKIECTSMRLSERMHNHKCPGKKKRKLVATMELLRHVNFEQRDPQLPAAVAQNVRKERILLEGHQQCRAATQALHRL